MAKIESNPTPSNADSPRKRATYWFRQPMLMYITMVTAFVICAIFVVHYVIVAQEMGRP
ncbi:MAG TPA: hypothetical protein VHX86_02195 [Tepidisphaeraceae bacterium]|jgi:hypothetical protein|nr:hypothetical protein [Tepidisphaeraceae bacterium]